MSEAIRFGRKPVYLVTLTVFVAFQLPTALAKNFGMLLAFRFLSGIFGAPVLAMGGASINDMYPPTQRGYAIIVWVVVSIVAPGKLSKKPHLCFMSSFVVLKVLWRASYVDHSIANSVKGLSLTQL